jgi:hypothetical protein
LFLELLAFRLLQLRHLYLVPFLDLDRARQLLVPSLVA